MKKVVQTGDFFKKRGISKTSQTIKHVVFFMSLFVSALTITSCKTQKNEIQPVHVHAFGHIAATQTELAGFPRASAPPPGGVLPGSYFLPIPSVRANQGQQPSCTSFATATALSIGDHGKLGTPYLDGGIFFSSAYLFNQAHDPNGCALGSSTLANFNILVNQGDCSGKEMPFNEQDCSTQPDANQRNAATPYKIDHFFAINPINVGWIKQFIFAGMPVIIAFQVDQTFNDATANTVWKAFGSASLGRHCAVLYGWDDSRSAFKLLNSWGNDWGDNGTTWVDYGFIENGSSPVWGKIFDEAYILQNPPVQSSKPVADFGVTSATTSINPNQQISFQDKSTNNPTSWAWSFPGGVPSTSTLQNPTITYPNAGSFTVSLTVNNANGTDSKSVTNYVSVISAGHAPIAQFSAIGNTNIVAGSSVTFQDNSLNSPTSWNWTFPGGNPSSSTAQNPTVIYQNTGTFDVSLTVTNQTGSNKKTSLGYIKVTANQGWACGQPYTDPRDGQVYPTVSIGGGCWIAKNLNYTNGNTVGVDYQNNVDPSSGKLYSFSDVVNGNLAPVGWHIPTSDEITALNQFVNSNGGALKSTNNWASPNVGATNSTGFSAVPSGMFADGVFYDKPYIFYMWSSTAQGNGGTAVVIYNNRTDFYIGPFNGTYYFAVRLVKNN